MALLGLGVDAAHSRTATFIALIISLFALILANRHPDHALVARGGSRNRWVRRMFAAILLLLALAIGVPFLREVMGLVVPTPADLLGAAIVFVLTFLWLEGLRLALHLFVRSTPSTLARENP